MTSPPLTIAFIHDEESPWQLLGLLPNQTDHNFKRIAAVLEALGHQVVHIDGLRDLLSHQANRNHTTWDLAFNIAEGMYGLAREAQVPCLLEAYEIPFTFADAATTSLCSDKGRTKVRTVSITTYLRFLEGGETLNFRLRTLDGTPASGHPHITFRHHSNRSRDRSYFANSRPHKRASDRKFAPCREFTAISPIRETNRREHIKRNSPMQQNRQT